MMDISDGSDTQRISDIRYIRQIDRQLRRQLHTQFTVSSGQLDGLMVRSTDGTETTSDPDGQSVQTSDDGSSGPVRFTDRRPRMDGPVMDRMDGLLLRFHINL